MLRWVVLAALVAAVAAKAKLTEDLLETEEEEAEEADGSDLSRKADPAVCSVATNDTSLVSPCCRPSTKTCKKYPYGGVCVLNWPWFTAHCDATFNVCEHPWCTCCVDCDRNVRSQCTVKQGRCRRYCIGDEYTAKLRCHSKYCKCCKTCEETRECNRANRIPGFCLGNIQYCNSTQYISGTAKCKRGCKCCMDCVAKPECSDYGGYCQRKGIQCDPGYVASDCGCEQEECICCKPDCDRDGRSNCSMSTGVCQNMKCGVTEFDDTDTPCNHEDCRCCKACMPTPECKSSTTKGFCVSDMNFCGKDSYISQTERCMGKGCHCCKICHPLQDCTDRGGFCQRGSLRCPNGTTASQAGCRGDNCVCCVPDTTQDCRATERCSLPSDFCSPTGCNPPFAMLMDGCISNGQKRCYCCKSLSFRCDREQECIDASGYCSTTGCRDGYYESTGCKSLDLNCKCCKPGFVEKEKNEAHQLP